MKTLTSLFAALLLLTACTQEKPDSTAPADYRETYNDLVQNKKDSVNQDTSAVHPPADSDSALQRD